MISGFVMEAHSTLTEEDELVNITTSYNMVENPDSKLI